MLIKSILTGNTVRLEAEFTNLEGQPIDPSFVRVVIYDKQYREILNTQLGEGNKTGVGKYFFNFTTPINPSSYIYEFNGEMDGFPILDRARFQTEFVKG